MSEGYSVQLKHDEKETSWEDHGFVKVSAGERLLAECVDYQHNRFLQTGNSAARTKELIAACKAKALDPSEDDQAPAEDKDEAEAREQSDFGSSTAVPSDGGVA